MKTKTKECLIQIDVSELTGGDKRVLKSIKEDLKRLNKANNYSKVRGLQLGEKNGQYLIYKRDGKRRKPIVWDSTLYKLAEKTNSLCLYEGLQTT